MEINSFLNEMEKSVDYFDLGHLIYCDGEKFVFTYNHCFVSMLILYSQYSCLFMKTPNNSHHYRNAHAGKQQYTFYFVYKTID